MILGTVAALLLLTLWDFMAKLGSEQRRYLVEHLSVLLVVAGLCVLLSISGSLSFFNRYVYDNLMQWLPMEPSGDVLIVGID